MHLVCLDLEGVLVPEIWLAVAEKTGIEQLRLTTRDISDYDVLMKKRISVLKSHGIKLKDIQDVIGRMEPLDGAAAFLEELRSFVQVVILSDTFLEFAGPVLERLNRPTLFCNRLIVDGDGTIRDYALRQPEGKRNAVLAFKSMGLRVIAAGDSYNDLAMLSEADAGILFRPPDRIREDFTEFPVYYEYGPFLDRVREFTGR